MNPFRMGITAATDTHNSIPGKVEDDSYPGHVGTVDDSPAKRLGAGTVTHDTVIDNPGGLVGVWAEEKSRDSIYAALHRGETFATSGPRIRARLFGGWDWEPGICDAGMAAMAAAGYAEGATMGGDMPVYPGSGAPSLVVWAAADQVPLMKVQVVKGWIDAGGEAMERVYDVAGDLASTATVDEATCEPIGTGADELCTVWTDPDFDPAEPSYYYVRVIQNPTCRWTAWDCMTFDPGSRPVACDDPGLPVSIQERAWTTPVWYTP